MVPLKQTQFKVPIELGSEKREALTPPHESVFGKAKRSQGSKATWANKASPTRD